MVWIWSLNWPILRMACLLHGWSLEGILMDLALNRGFSNFGSNSSYTGCRWYDVRTLLLLLGRRIGINSEKVRD